MAFNAEEFVTETPKSVPVLLLLDVSGSMSGERINNLNDAVEMMIEEFRKAQTMETFIKLGIITFGGEDAKVHTLLSEVDNIEFGNLRASGMTPLGGALRLAKNMVEDKAVFLSRDYRPAIILVSDGEPNDKGWEEAMSDFVSNGRSAKCDRFAVAVGEDVNKDMLRRFIGSCENPLLEAHTATDIMKVLKKVTMSVSQRTSSVNKNASVKMDDINLDDIKPDDDDIDF